MLDDPRRHRRRLYIANPDPDEVLDTRDDDEPAARLAYADPAHYHYHWPSPVYQSHLSPAAPSHYIPPLAAVVTANIAHPAPSPPSTSPAADDSSSPPPLPALPQPDPSAPDPALLDLAPPSADRSASDAVPPWSGRVLRSLGSPPHQHARGPRPVDPHARRPRIVRSRRRPLNICSFFSVSNRVRPRCQHTNFQPSDWR